MNFDRVASIYDATRTIPPDVVELVMRRVVEATHAGPETEFLEPGVGTGRIALPFIRAGYRYTGVDVSEKMLEQLRAKVAGGAPNLTIVRGDATALPLADNCMDVVMTVHVLHLIPEWHRAMDEIQRVLRPYGYFVMGRNAPVNGNPAEEIMRQWRTFVEERGVSLRPTYGTWDAVDAELTRRGGRTAVYRVAAWSREIRPSDLLNEQRKRIVSVTWSVPDDVLADVADQMTAWVIERYGDLDVTLGSQEEFLVSITRLPA